MRVDVHAHYYPIEYLDYLDKHGGSPVGTGMSRDVFGGGSERDLSVRLASMDQAEVAIQVLSSSAQVPAFADPSIAADGARLCNRLFSELVRRYPDRLIGLGTLPLPHVDSSIAEIGYCMDELSMPGVGLVTSVLEQSIADPAFEPVFAELDQRKAVLFLHPAMLGASCEAINEFHLSSTIGHAVEDALALVSLLQRGILDRYPNIQLVSAHMGGFVPYVFERVDRHLSSKEPGSPSAGELLRRVWYDTANAHPPALRCLCDTVGTSRVVVGTDFPHSRDQAFQRQVAFLDDSGLSDEQVHAIREVNGATLFHLI
jgi:predicted TIM-barrel fold metal-dependent hydrolase